MLAFIGHLHRSVGFWRAFASLVLVFMCLRAAVSLTWCFLFLGKDKYLPLFVSVKSHVYFSPKAAKKEYDRMMEAVEASDKSEESNSGEKLGALCILAIFGSGSSESQDAEYKLDPSCVQELVKRNVVSKVLRIQDNDVVGISFLEFKTPETEDTEAFASHSCIGLHCNDGDLELKVSVIVFCVFARKRGAKRDTAMACI